MTTTTKRFFLTFTFALAAASPLSADGLRYRGPRPYPTPPPAVIQPVPPPVVEPEPIPTRPVYDRLPPVPTRTHGRGNPHQDGRRGNPHGWTRLSGGPSGPHEPPYPSGDPHGDGRIDDRRLPDPRKNPYWLMPKGGR